MPDHSVHKAGDLAQASEIGSRVQDASEEEIDALIEEAFAATRGGRG